MDPTITPYIGLFDFMKVKPFFDDQAVMQPIKVIWFETKNSLLNSVKLVKRSMDLDKAKLRIKMNEDCIRALRNKDEDYKKELRLQNDELKGKYMID